eukprot:CAMPEP_0178760814 /NCGR_PEP_ID=MMETSP0744-20121128/15692_1 /TAXON_ID=913974 /ORGANISM="Nitzschia punctata, Strain CCMP561" /LENGTH=264 /DNA_ID=CAMNT_0020415415 /DNA_START=125 /DNA_END=919 /DNA_ORIENTATION=-
MDGTVKEEREGGGKEERKTQTMELTVNEIKAVSNIVVYKVLADGGCDGSRGEGSEGSGSRSTLASYNAVVGGPAAADTLDGNESLQLVDWRGLYTQFQREHVVGTIPYRWERGCTYATLVAVTFDRLDVVMLDDAIFHDRVTSGSQKAAVVKERLNIASHEPLIATLGDRGKVALVRETADEWELIIPHNLLPRLNFQERVIAIFHRQKHPTMPVTWKWKQMNDDDEGNKRWILWDSGDDHDLEDLKQVIPDLELTWLEDRERK